MLVFITIFAVLFIMALLYLKLAKAKQIQDISIDSEDNKTVVAKGAGIIIIPAIILFILFFHQQIDSHLAYFILGLLIIAVLSFIDDLKSLPIATRLIFQSLAVTLIYISFGFFVEVTIVSIILLFGAYLLSIGYINISNFMDGINGMSVLNALSAYVTFYIINTYVIAFTNSNLIVVFILVTLVLGFFNFRKMPKWFLGDVGSISFGFTMLYFALKLFLLTKNLFVFLLISTYVLDGGWTIVERLFKRENIFKAHLSHLYELLVYKLKIPHLKIALVYFIFQVILNGLVFISLIKAYKSTSRFIILAGLLSLLYFAIKFGVYKHIKNKNEVY